MQIIILCSYSLKVPSLCVCTCDFIMCYFVCINVPRLVMLICMFVCIAIGVIDEEHIRMHMRSTH